jgi:protein-tyrosine phosphatase
MRTLEWDGYANARDLGGLPSAAASGATVHGRVARGPRRERLTATGWAEARRWGLRTVVDLRCPYEIGQRAGDPDGPADALAGLTVHATPTEDQDDPEFRRICFPILDSPEYWAHNWRLQPSLVRRALEAAASAGPGVLVHCSAGRDRTGMIVALLLGNALVDPDAVAADYAQSVHAMAGGQSSVPTEDRQQAWTPQQVDTWLADKLPIVRGTAADAPRILVQLGVDDATRARLRSLLLDERLPLAG